MAKYIVLVNWTAQGIRAVTETTQRAAGPADGRADGWPAGEAALDAGPLRPGCRDRGPNAETVAVVGLRTGMQGAVHTETLGAFDAEEMSQILAELG